MQQMPSTGAPQQQEVVSSALEAEPQQQPADSAALGAEPPQQQVGVFFSSSFFFPKLNSAIIKPPKCVIDFYIMSTE